MQKIEAKYLDEAMRWVASNENEHLEDLVAERMAESIENRVFIKKCSELLKAIADGDYRENHHESLVAGIIATAFQIGRHYGNQEMLRRSN